MTQGARRIGGKVSTLVRRLGIAVIFGAITLAAIPASAQDISIGYQWQQFSFDLDDEVDVFVDDSLTAPLGFNIDVAGPITSALDVFGQFDWSRQSEGFDIFGEDFESTWNFTTFGGGIRWSGRTNPAITPFVHGLFGVTHTTFGCEIPGFNCEDLLEEVGGDDLSSTDPMMQLGGGVAVPVGNWSVLGQFDWRRIFGENEGVNSIRFVIGIRLSLR
jgi:hypothetical protein